MPIVFWAEMARSALGVQGQARMGESQEDSIEHESHGTFNSSTYTPLPDGFTSHEIDDNYVL